MFLMDGVSSGRIKCTISNWSGVAYKIPRLELENNKDLDVLKHSGVYLLFGEPEDQGGKDVVYIGQAGTRKNGEGVLNRLLEHMRNEDKNYWNEVVIFTTTNNTYGPTEISYLEHRFTQLAAKANRYKIKNRNEPSLGNVTEEKASELEEYIDLATMVIGTLGHRVFDSLYGSNTQPVANTSSAKPTEGLELFLTRKSRKSGQTITARCRRTNEGFVLLKGSQIETIDSESIPPAIKDKRGVGLFDSQGILQQDVLFKSPSSAASFVVGTSSNGLAEWKTAEGKPLKDVDNV